MGRGRILSFKNAFAGINIAFKEEANFKFHVFVAILVIALGLIFSITFLEWLALFLTIGFVICLELTNTAIEEVVNSFTKDQHPAAKKAKDVAAGAVLFSAITSIIIGSLIFIPYFLELFNFFLQR